MGETTESIDSDGEETDGAGDFDLAAELLGALNGEESGRFAGGAGGTTEEEGFEQVFAAFKQGVQQELGEGDIEAHYDLGIAYKEMGLLEDAIGEFRIALGGPARKLASLHAMGLCALELDRVSDAIAHLEQALALPEVPNEQQTGLRFDLGRAYQQQGDLERARGAFEAVAAVDPDFGAVSERIAELDRSESSVGVDPLAAEQPEETFESFDDFIDGAEPPTESESYESFDDLMSDDEDDGFGEPEPEMDAVPEPEPEAAEIEMELAPEPEAAEPEMELAPEPEAAEPEMEPAPEPELEDAEIGMELAPEPEAAELEMESESEDAELEMEPAPEPEPEAAEFEMELRPLRSPKPRSSRWSRHPSRSRKRRSPRWSRRRTRSPKPRSSRWSLHPSRSPRPQRSRPSQLRRSPPVARRSLSFRGRTWNTCRTSVFREIRSQTIRGFPSSSSTRRSRTPSAACCAGRTRARGSASSPARVARARPCWCGICSNLSRKRRMKRSC